MRLMCLLTASAFALSTGAAMAQMAPPSGGMNGAPAAPGVTAPAMQRMPAVDPFTQDDVSQIVGVPVYGAANTKIGSVSNVLMNPATKSIDRLVVAQGGVLGVGAHHVALPIKDFRWDQQFGGFSIEKTGNELSSMAEWRAPSTAAGATTEGSGSSMPPGAQVPSAHSAAH
jgi:sporulation protein YlmC with PRC-barrel domain